MGTLRTLWAKTKASNWVNKPYTRGTTAWKVQQGASKVTRALTGGGASRASKVLKGVGGYAGGWAGAQVGMMIGAGGIIGGAIGGIAGSKFGESVGNAINKGWHKLFG